MDGFINLHKEQGYSSQQAVAAVKRLLHCKCGHCGTLDPAATGVLPVALGKATRLAEYVMGQEKSYVGEICFGVVTDSYDGAGETVSERDASFVTAAMIKEALPRFCGRILQAPPAVSALKRGGEPLYKKVRRGEAVQTTARPVMIYQLTLLDFTAGGPHPRCRVEVRCGQGAYIRSLAHDLGQALGCGAHLSALQRTRVGRFTLPASYTLEQVAALHAAGRDNFLLPMNEALVHLPSFTAPERVVRQLAHGNAAALTDGEASGATAGPLLRVVDSAGRLLGMGHILTNDEGGLLNMDKVLAEAEQYRQQNEAVVACAIGNFDGLHLGHRALFKEMNRLKRRYGGSGAAVTFAPHPLTVITGSAPELLTSDELKAELLKEFFAVDQIITLPFDRALMNMTPEQFVREIIVARLGVQEVVVGYNFTFGARGAGNAGLLRELCAAQGVRVTVIEAVRGRYGEVSSSNIRARLKEGDLEAANEMLGYWFTLAGKVVSGSRIGRTIGFPTANFYPVPGQALPPNGVYAARIAYRERTYNGVVNFGVKPTIAGDRQPLVEAHIFDEQDDLYGEVIRVYFGKFLRPEMRFNGLDELTAQIIADSRAARKYLSPLPGNQHLPKKIG